MAGAEVIGAAIGVLLLILVGYLVVGSTLTAAEIVTTAQKDVTLQNEARLNTAIKISQFLPFPDPAFSGTPPLGTPPFTLTIYIKNTGSEAISDFKHMDILITDLSVTPYTTIHYSFDPVSVGPHDQSTSKWSYTSPLLVPPFPDTPEKIHLNMLDPGEVMKVDLTNYPADFSAYSITVSTPNGVSDTYNK